MYPLKLKPIYDKTIWGNDRLTTLRGMKEKGLGTCWEISAHPHADNIVINGEYAGSTLGHLLKEYPTQMLGERNMHQLLRLAYLDAMDDLSIQVHPYDAYAREYEHDEGKTESWYILEAQPGATLVAGTSVSDPAIIRQAVKEKSVEQYVRKIPVTKGDFVCIDAGMLHALGKGILAIEVGQNSNTTYRFYDYQRKDAMGNERELHIEKSFDVSDFSMVCEKISTPFQEVARTAEKSLVDRNEFSVILIDIKEAYAFTKKAQSFHCLSNVGEDCTLTYNGETYEFAYTENIFVPADVENFTIKGNTRILLSYVR